MALIYTFGGDNYFMGKGESSFKISVKPHRQRDKRERGMEELNERERQVLRYIKSFMKENGTIPTLREIGEGVGLKSTMTVHKYFTQLADKGYIKYKSGKNYMVVGMEYQEVVK